MISVLLSYMIRQKLIKDKEPYKIKVYSYPLGWWYMKYGRGTNIVYY